MRSIRWKLIAVSLLIVFLPVYLLNRYAIESFDRFTRTVREDEMGSIGFMIGEQYKAMVLGIGENAVGSRPEEFAGLLRTYSEQVDARMHIVSPKGVVLFDSDPDDPVVSADFSDRAEITKAGTGKYAANWKLTENKKFVFYYVAVPIRHKGSTVGIAYVAGHTGRITNAIRKMVQDQKVSLLLALGGALVISVVLAHTLTHRLRKLTKASKEYASGHAPFQLETRGRDEIGELGRAVGHMATEIENRNAYNRDFVSTVMHELKTPVTAIKGAAEVLEGGAADDASSREKFLGNIRYEADRLTRMVGELGELTKLDMEIPRGQKESVDYCTCVREILERLIPTFEEEHAKLDVKIPDEAIATLIMPGRIEQVISNLLENAFRYTPATGTVEVAVKRGDGEVLTFVKDSGRGIPAGSTEKIFDRFYTTEPKDVPREYGSGLGLAIAKSIIENHKGRIWAESQQGEGATFTFSLPVFRSS